MIEVPFKYVEDHPGEYKILLDENLRVHYFRPTKKVYVVRHWWNDNDYSEHEFDTLEKAKKYGLERFDTFDINVYGDVSFRYWDKQYQYTNKELIGVEEQ